MWKAFAPFCWLVSIARRKAGGYEITGSVWMEGISFLKALNLAVTQLAHFSELFLGTRTVIGVPFFFLLLLLDRVAKQSKDCRHPWTLQKKGFPYQDFASFFLVIESLGTYSRWEIDYKGMHDGITSDRISKKKKNNNKWSLCWKRTRTIFILVWWTFLVSPLIMLNACFGENTEYEPANINRSCIYSTTLLNIWRSTLCAAREKVWVADRIGDPKISITPHSSTNWFQNGAHASLVI